MLKENADHESYNTDIGTNVQILKKLSGTNTSALPEGVDPSKSWNTLASPARTMRSTNHGRPESAATNHKISLRESNQSHDFPWGANKLQTGTSALDAN
jgi:hypothetical protein